MPSKKHKLVSGPEELKLAPFMRLLKAVHSMGEPESFTPEDLEKQRRSQDALGNMAASMSGLVWEPFTLAGMDAAWMRLSREHRRRRVILYCHGGGYTSGGLGFSKVLASKLTRATGMDTLAFDYRLAPEHPYPAAVEDALTAWGHLESLGIAPGDIVLAGDSAGGNLALVLCLKLREAGRGLPGALLLMSPWTDMTASGESLRGRAGIDPVLTPEYMYAVREAYAGGLDPSDCLLSPLFADFAGFPPALIQVGTHEILYSDAERLAERMLAAGADCRLEVWENMWHDFQMYPSKTASNAIQNMAHFLLEVL
uniref:alpha/beta hydrolase n=3 Tax=Candidatus Scatomorpha intestinigallinarum TaxID=2840923 RepID=UPI004027D4CB